MKLNDCYVGAKIAIQSALKPSLTTLLALSNSEIVGTPFKAKNGLYRVEVADADGALWVLLLNRISLRSEIAKLRMRESL